MISVLYVDDEPGLLEIGKIFLELDKDFSIDTSISGKDALAVIKSRSYDAIISDYQMPEMDGIALLKEVRKLYGDIPFILFTGRGREEIVIEAINNGVDFYLQKGGDPKSQFAELGHKIHKAVSRKRAEEALNESERRFRELADLLPQGIYEAGIDGRLTYANRHALEMFGYANEDIRNGMNIITTIAHKDREQVGKAFRRIVEQGSNPKVSAEYLALRKDGSIFPVAIFSSPVLRNGRITGIRGIIMDMTERRLAEEKIRKSEERYRSVVNDQTEMICRFSLDGTITFTNEMYRSSLGPILGLDEVIGKNIRDIMQVKNFPAVEQFLRSLTPEQPIHEMERRITGRDGKTYWQHWSVRALFDRDGRTVEYQTVGRDITEKKRTDEELFRKNDELNAAYEQLAATEEQLRANLDELTAKEIALRESESRLRSFIESTKDSVTLVDEEGKVLEWNAGAEQISGIQRGEAFGRYVWDLFFRMSPSRHRTEEHRAALKQMIQTMLRTGVPASEGPRVIESERPDGTRIFVSQEIFPIRTAKGFRLGSIAQDITERRIADDALVQAKKKLALLSSINRHDIKNQLMILNGFVTHLRKKIPDPSYDQYFSRILAASSKITSIIMFAKEYEQLGLYGPVWQNIQTIAKMAAVDLLPESIHLNVTTENLEVFADPMLMLVLYNLLENSKAHGEHVTEIAILFTREENRGTLIVEDNGIGIPAPLKGQIFERGFGQKTGLGLFLIREILAITNLSIQETGTEGNGARFAISLPPGTWRLGTG